MPPLLAFLLVAVLGWLLLRPAPQTSASSTLIGQPAPDFTLTALDGQNVHLAALRGQPVVLNFWASWCGPCKDEAPLFHDLSTRQSAGQFKLVGLLFQETSKANAEAFIKRNGLGYANILPPNIDTGVSYSISGIPVTVFIDRAGVVRDISRGGLDRERLNTGLRSIGLPEL